MALASRAHVEAHLGRTLTESEATRITTLLDEASDLVEGYCGQEFDGGIVPRKVERVVAKIAARALTSPPELIGLEQQSAGAFSVGISAAASAGDIYMTASDKRALRFNRTGGALSLGAVSDRTPEQP